MKLLTQEILKKTPALYAQDGKGDEAIVYAKFFDPCGAFTWFMTELNPETGEAFGLVVGHEVELGYFSIPELQAFRGRLGLGIERDRHFSPTKMGEVKKDLLKLGVAL
jgi:hypothetical protein